jgi:ribosomal protein S16
MKCACCQTVEFSPDVKSDDAPIMSQSCGHSACRGCVRQMYLQLVEKHGNTRKWVACPICRKSQAFPGDEEKQNVNRALCEALQIIDQQKKALLQQQQKIYSEEQEEKQVAVLVKKETQEIQEIVEKKRRTDHAHAGAANNTTAEIPSIKNQEQPRLPIADATRNASSNKPPVGVKKKLAEQSDHEEDNDYESIDAINRCRFGGHAVQHQQVPHEEMLLYSDKEESENDSSSSVHLDAIQQTSGNKRRRQATNQSFDDRFNDLMSFKAKYGHCDASKHGEDSSLGQEWCIGLRGSYQKMLVDTFQQFQDEMVSSDEESENDSTSSVHLDAIQQTSGNKRKRQATNQSFDDRFNDLMAFKAKYGHCDVPYRGEDSSLGQWCTLLRRSYKKIQNYQKPNIKLSDEQIQRLNDAGFKWSLQKAKSGFDERFNDLMAFKAQYGHCDVSRTGENASLGQWCSDLRKSYKKIQNNQKPNGKLSDAQIQRLNDAGFKWSQRVRSGFDEHFNDLMVFKAKFGHCDVSQGEDASLGRWCSQLRGSYKKIQNNQKPNTKLSDEQIQRLNDAGFKWSQKVRSGFDEHFNDLMAFKAKYGHFDVSRTEENASLGQWCSDLRRSYKKIQNNQKPRIKLSDEQIQRLNDAGFKWSLKVGSAFDEHFNDLMAFKAKYGHCDVSRGEDAVLGRCCSHLRGSYKKIQNKQKPSINLSDEQIQCLEEAGFKWSQKVGSAFDEHFSDLMVFKAKYGHCDVSRGENASLGRWCSQLRASYKKIQNKQKPKIKLSDEQIQRLNDAGFKWSHKVRSGFDEHFSDLMVFKAKYSHCNVSRTGENASLGKWCSQLRGSYKKMQKNEKPKRKLSDEQIQRLKDAGFTWSLRKQKSGCV